jgi:hypothetical protein
MRTRGGGDAHRWVTFRREARESGGGVRGIGARVPGKAPGGVFMEESRRINGCPIHQECNVEVLDALPYREEEKKEVGGGLR